jgi:hypothetical protein
MASPFSWPVLVPSALCAPAPVNLGVSRLYFLFGTERPHGCFLWPWTDISDIGTAHAGAIFFWRRSFHFEGNAFQSPSPLLRVNALAAPTLSFSVALAFGCWRRPKTEPLLMGVPI